MTVNNFQFNKEKSLNAVLYIAKNVKSSDFHKLFKILYFSDRNHLAEYGYPITGDSYIAMEAGPVPSKIYDIFKIIRGDSYMKDTEHLSDYFVVEGWMYIKPLKEANMNKLTLNEKEVIDKCISQYGNLSYDEIKEKSHDIAWRSTAKDFEINMDDIAREAGLDNDDIQYIKDFNNLKNTISQWQS